MVSWGRSLADAARRELPPEPSRDALLCTSANALGPYVVIPDWAGQDFIRCNVAACEGCSNNGDRGPSDDTSDAWGGSEPLASEASPEKTIVPPLLPPSPKAIIAPTDNGADPPDSLPSDAMAAVGNNQIYYGLQTHPASTNRSPEGLRLITCVMQGGVGTPREASRWSLRERRATAERGLRPRRPAPGLTPSGWVKALAPARALQPWNPCTEG